MVERSPAPRSPVSRGRAPAGRAGWRCRPAGRRRPRPARLRPRPPRSRCLVGNGVVDRIPVREPHHMVHSAIELRDRTPAAHPAIRLDLVPDQVGKHPLAPRQSVVGPLPKHNVRKVPGGFHKATGVNPLRERQRRGVCEPIGAVKGRSARERRDPSLTRACVGERHRGFCLLRIGRWWLADAEGRADVGLACGADGANVRLDRPVRDRRAATRLMAPPRSR